MRRRWTITMSSVLATGVMIGGMAAATAGPAGAAISPALTASAPGVTSKTITIGYVTSQTGVASSTFADGPAAAQARVALQNAHGGIDGRKLVLVAVDDQSSLSGDQTAAQVLVSQKNVFGVVDFSPFMFAGAKYLNQQGIPVTGEAFDGPEWNMQPYTNMFSYGPPSSTPINGFNYTYTTGAQVMKMVGVTKLAGLGYGISQSSKTSITTFMAAAEKLGIKNCYENLSVPFGGVDFTAAVLAIKSAGCDGVVGSFVDASDLALSSAVKNAGLTNVKQMYFTGYDDQIQSNANNRAAFMGNYVAVSYDPHHPANGAVANMFAALRKYDPQYKGGIPDLGIYGSYISTDLMIQGLQLAGTNPSRPSFISKLRKLGSYNAGGLLLVPTTFTGFGTAAALAPKSCAQYAYMGPKGFVYFNNAKPICGGRLAVPVG